MNKPLLLLLLSHLFLASVQAKPLASVPGWAFTLSANAGYVGGQSHFSVSDDNAQIASINRDAQLESRFIGFPFARVEYTTQDLHTQFFVGNSREQIAISQFQYELGMVHQFSDNSKFTAAYFPELPFFNETWEDPFLVGEDRVETEENAQGARIELQQVAGTPITFKYAYAQSRVDNEKSGESWSQILTTEELNNLQRDSTYHRVAVETMFPIGPKVFLKPTLQYTTRMADGEANSYQDYNFQLGLLMFKGRHTSITTMNIGNTLYKEVNPLFDMKQNSINAGIFSTYSYSEAFNWKPLTFTVLAGYNLENSDITFYDEQGFIVSTGLAYSF